MFKLMLQSDQWPWTLLLAVAVLGFVLSVRWVIRLTRKCPGKAYVYKPRPDYCDHASDGNYRDVVAECGFCGRFSCPECVVEVLAGDMNGYACKDSTTCIYWVRKQLARAYMNEMIKDSLADGA